MLKTQYITTTLPYVNADPHIGFAMELIRADIIARWKKLSGFEVFFNTGTDEHGQKLYDAAKEHGEDVQGYVDRYAQVFKDLQKVLGISEDVHFVRTTDPAHEKAAQEFWKLCDKNGYIYKKNYEVKYCVGCELEKTDSELVDGHCPIHPKMEIELINEENYFFKFSAFTEKLSKFYEDNPSFVIPDTRYNEIKAFVARGLEDFSISRLKLKMSWGVPVPGDDEHVMYVWFDALVSYISTLGWSHDMESFERFWKNGNPIQYCGKDNIRQQAAMWQAMLMAAGLPNSHMIVVDGFITGEGGVKMSKSIGNVVNPKDIVDEYGTDALRYFLAREVSSFEDSPFTLERFKASYNAGLANGLGNLVSRIMKMAETYLGEPIIKTDSTYETRQKILEKGEFGTAINNFDISKATEIVWGEIKKLDLIIQTRKPFEVVKTQPEAAREMVKHELVEKLAYIAQMLESILPETAQEIKTLIRKNKSPEAPLFARKD